MIGYIITAIIALLIGAALTYFYQKHIQSMLIKTHEVEIAHVESNWFKGGWDAGVEFAKHECKIEAIKKGQTPE